MEGKKKGKETRSTQKKEKVLAGSQKKKGRGGDPWPGRPSLYFKHPPPQKEKKKKGVLDSVLKEGLLALAG